MKRGFYCAFFTKKMMMQEIVKQVLGIDVSQNELVVCYGRMYSDWDFKLVSHKVFPNNPSGFSALLAWTKALTDNTKPLRFVLEATGVYHERFAHHLHEKGFDVSVILPNKINSYARSLTTKTVTDKTDSEAITRFGLERKLEDWIPAKGVYRALQLLSRERGQLVDERTAIKNKLHAKGASFDACQHAVARGGKRLALLDKQIAEIELQIKSLIAKDGELKAVFALLLSITGIGLITATSILGETNGFELVRGRRQLTSFAGLDVMGNQSGTSINGKARISKRGNKHLRKAMHMGALSAIKHSPKLKDLYERIFARTGIKMKGLVAVQRKLLELSYTIYKTGVAYDKDYQPNEVTQKSEVALPQ